jgi:hypothetical protein
MSRLRSLDSKISFFAFADIITSVSGVLIFIALLLATDLGRPIHPSSAGQDSETEQQLQETLARQLQVDAQNRRLEEVFAAVATAPALEKLKADVARLHAQLSAEQKKQTALSGQMADSQASLAARDKVLGLTSLNTSVQRTVQKAAFVARQEAAARAEMEKLEPQVTRVESQLLKLRQWENQVWLIPETNATSKEPIVIFVNGSGVTIQHVDHPEQRQDFDQSIAHSAFKEYLGSAKPLNQYIVFEVKPSGIGLFKDLVKTARDMGFEVGYDALEENKNPHLTPIPAVDESTAPATPSTGAATPNSTASPGNGAVPAGPMPAATPPPSHQPPPAAQPTAAAPPKPKSWWQRLLEWAGLE